MEEDRTKHKATKKQDKRNDPFFRRARRAIGINRLKIRLKLGGQKRKKETSNRKAESLFTKISRFFKPRKVC